MMTSGRRRRDRDDVPVGKLDNVLLANSMKFFKLALEDGASLLKTKVLASDEYRFEMWFCARYTDGESVDGGTSSTKVVITPEFQKDLDEQGMSSAQDLFGFELVDSEPPSAAVPRSAETPRQQLGPTRRSSP